MEEAPKKVLSPEELYFEDLKRVDDVLDAANNNIFRLRLEETIGPLGKIPFDDAREISNKMMNLALSEKLEGKTYAIVAERLKLRNRIAGFTNPGSLNPEILSEVFPIENFRDRQKEILDMLEKRELHNLKAVIDKCFSAPPPTPKEPDLKGKAQEHSVAIAIATPG